MTIEWRSETLRGVAEGEERHIASTPLFGFSVNRPFGYAHTRFVKEADGTFRYDQGSTWFLHTGAMSTIGPIRARSPGGLRLNAKTADDAKVEATSILKKWLTDAAAQL